MRYIIIALIAALSLAAFNWPKCEHKFTAVEAASVQMEQPCLRLGGGVYQEFSWPSGIHEGKELICVKCFHIQKQVLDYGQAFKGPTLTEWLHNGRLATIIDTCLPITMGTMGAISIDTSGMGKFYWR